jgi:autonomous glycyl radical cofactor GrcA
MNNLDLSKISKEIEDPNIKIETSKKLNSNVLKQRVNVDILKQRLLKQKKKDRFKRTIILSTVVVSLGALTMLTY